ncbi:uncharacterized protein BDZ83DRAFT_653926 [Colletotrichum acutatum]|uniref:C2H2-type domain-containing protein n=1 Tax=Glomerella acutata TaxID=27357 RepID=A0AAD8UEI6_GLOAC|nr:uncharacterized protein BDZ83DRAFT_653926 [Colletotrichum acutatum]KAK1722451.1 hypothetical protein BDZ83DRAFT_653926 [Colletotrichum acutatum]
MTKTHVFTAATPYFFDLAIDLRDHEETHNFDNNGNIITFHCTFDGCSDTFNDAKLWRSHEEEAHPGRFNTGIHWMCGDNVAGTNEPCNVWFTYQDQQDFVQHIMSHNEGRQALTHLDVGSLLQAYCYPGHYEGFWCKLCFKPHKFRDHHIYENLRRQDPFQNVRLDHIQQEYIDRPEASAQSLRGTQTITRGVVIN